MSVELLTQSNNSRDAACSVRTTNITASDRSTEQQADAARSVPTGKVKGLGPKADVKSSGIKGENGNRKSEN